uniref:VWFA domain-containing protein n=1 Tax=Pygocentrus nattereri TaxID=42514 RepID=A0AAR2JDL9_PYGNA
MLTNGIVLFPVDFDMSRKDVVFLLDGSDGTRNGFPAMLDFVQKVVEKLNVEENRDRVSVVQYSRDPETHFYLNTYSEETDVLDTIKTLRHRGGRPLNTGSALQYVRDNVFTSSAGSRSQQGVPQILILLSGSSGFPAMKDFVLRVMEKLNVAEDKDRVSVVQFSRDPETHFYLNTYTRKDDIVDTVSVLRHKGGRPLNTGAALQYVRDNVFTASSGSRRLEGVPQILILLSGARSFDNVDVPASALKDLGVLIFTIGSRGSDSRELQKISHEPKYALSVSDFTELPNVQEQLVNTVEAVSVPITPASPTPTVEFDISRRDVVFLLDGSDGTRNGFPAMLDFVQKVVEKLNVEENRDRVSVVQYSRDPETHFYLNTYSEETDVLDTIKTLRHRGGRPLNTGSALQYVRDNVFTSSAGSRSQQGVPQILILLSGSRSNDNVDTPASALKESGVLILGVGTRNSSREIQRIVSDPSYAQSISEISDLPSVQQQFLSTLASTVSYVTQVILKNKRDVVFLLDGSDGTRDSFPAIRDFVQRMVDRLNVSDRRDRVSVVQFSREPEAHFYLNTYTTKESVLNTVRGLRHRGGRPLNTGAALQYVRDNVFTASSGSRRLEGVPQLLILLSGGRSFDNIDMPASSLKELGVLTFAVGSRGSDSRELQKISYDPSSALSVTDFANLPTVQEQLFSRINTPEAQRRDVVFLLDGSDGTRSGFPAMKDFVLRVMEKLNVAEDKDRVSVVQFSRDPETHFYLNTYTRKDDIVDTVSVLRHKGGRPLNTGAALQYVRDNVFTASSGSRRLEGVPQILILLSGARSFDNVDVPASALKDLGVLIFTIGSRGSDSRELQKISHEPKYALSVSDFTELPNVQEQLVNTVEAVSVPITPASPTPTVEFDISRRDVVFLLDGSDGTRNGFPAMLDFVQKVVEKLNVEENRDRVSVVQYSRDPETHFYLNTYSEETDVLDTIKTLRHRGGRPLNTGSALQYVRDNVFTSSAGSRSQQGVPQILILLSGSRSNDNVDTPASALKESGVLILGVGTRNSSREIQRIVSDPSYAQSISEISDLPSVQQQFLSTLASTVSYVTDVVFLLDGSDGTRDSFPAMRDFVQRMVDRLNVSDRRDRVSVVQFSREPEAHFYLNTYTTKESVLNTVRGLRHRGGRPLNTGAALQYVRDNVFTASSGSRRLEGVPQLLILLSGGRSFDNIDMPASSLKELGVLTFAVGSRGSDSRELQKISYDPSSALSVTDFANLPTVQEQLFSRINTVREETKTVSPTQIAQRRDVVFLLDGSDGTRSGFPAMKDFVLRVMEKLNVAEDKDRVSVVQFSRDPETHFYLNTYTRKDDIVDTVSVLRHKGGRPLNTGAALQYVRDNVFTASSGSRRLEGVPQILILLSGARSFDNVDVPASALKDLGVLIFTIGSRGSDSRELQKISHEPKYALSVSDFTELPNVQEQLVNTVEAVSVPITPASPTPTVEFDISRRDVVFLLDGSDGTRNGFPAMLDFVQKVVEKLNVEENRDRVSVVQYSRDPETHFYLNTYSEETDVLDTIKTLRHRGGRPLNTGSALQYVRDNVFTSSAGSRSQQGVPQILILLSGSRSNDNVDTPASALKESGVLILGVGTRNSSREIQRIVSDPSYAQSISEISDLPSVQQQFLSTLASTIVTDIFRLRMTRRDVVFLLDGSDGTRDSFPAIRDFVQRMVDRLNVSDRRDRVSVVQFSREPEAHFYLNTYTTKESVLNTVRGLRHRGGRPLNTGAALQYVRDNVFTASSGSRRLEGVPQLLILLSGGRSFDNIDMPASSLKELGVLTFAVGSRGSDSRELQKISYDPSSALSVTDFANLPTVQEQLFSRINTVREETKTVSPTQIGKTNRVLIHDDIVDTVSVLRHKGGRPLNTGAALQYVRDNVFTASSGSRRLEGVPQILILLSGARSFDNVDVPASALKDLGVLIFTIGSRGSDSRELQKISHEPKYALSVSDFTELPNVQEQLVNTVEAVSVPITPASPTPTGMTA